MQAGSAERLLLEAEAPVATQDYISLIYAIMPQTIDFRTMPRKIRIMVIHMQDEINERIVVFSIRTAKLTGDMIIEAVKQYLSAQKTPNSNIHHGRQTLKQLIQQNAGVSSIEVSEQNIRLLKA